jgi:beta-fructofuranosidase
VLIFSVWDAGKTHYTAYAVGEYTGDTFIPQFIRRLDLGPDYYAPATMMDDRGRRLMWGWMREARRRAARVAAGWAGAMSVPRVLTLGDDDTLRVEPIPELARLHGARRHLAGIEVSPTAPYVLSDVRGDCLELRVTFEASDDATALGVVVRQSPDGEEHTSILYDRATRLLTLNRERASLAVESYRGTYNGAVDLADREAVTLRVLLDRSVVEVYANERACLSARLYPTRLDSVGLAIIAQGGVARVCSLDVWDMTPVTMPAPRSAAGR